MKLFFLICAILICPKFLISQGNEELERMAADFFEKEEYRQSLEAYLKLNVHNPDEPITLTRIGICYFETNNLAEAQDYFYQSFNAKNSAPIGAYLYLGKCYHIQLDFNKATSFYKIFLKNAGLKHPLRAAVKDDILRCATGLKIRRINSVADIVNLGSSVNSVVDDFKPLPSPNYTDIIYFSSNRDRQGSTFEPSFDIYTTTENKGAWDSPLPLGLVINSSSQEVVQTFGKTGDHLYFFRGNTLFSGDMLVDTFSENMFDKNLLYPKLESPVRAWEGDCDLQFFNDTIMLFASRRAGGFGGLDIYITTLTQHGWTTPENLGPSINSAYDERSPHLAPDGRNFYFSTNNARKSIGGYDILHSYFLDRTANWTPPENMGIPFNSADDDAYFSLLGNGRSGFFSSSRKSGLGGQDLFQANFHESRGKQLYTSDPVAFHLVKNVNAASQFHNSLQRNIGIEDANYIEIGPMPFSNPFMPLPDEMLPKLEYLSLWLKTYPTLKMTFVAHAGPTDNGQFPTRPVLQQIKDFMEEANVPLHQIRLLNVGASYPMKKRESHRVEPFVANPEVLPVLVKETNNGERSFQAKFLKTAMTGLVYQVQAPVEGNAMIDELLQFFPDGMLLQNPATKQSQFIPGIQLSWSAALEAEKELLELGFQDAEAVPFLNGWELTKKTAVQHLHEYPNLSNFIERKK